MCANLPLFRCDTADEHVVARNYLDRNAVPVRPDQGEALFDQPGFIYVPPCLWGSTVYPNGTFGLDPAVDLDGVIMHPIKTANATAGHHGEMAWQQMFMTAPITEEYKA